jgi:hypothetical protein
MRPRWRYSVDAQLLYMQTAERDAQQEGASAMPATDTPAASATPKQLSIKLLVSASLFEALDQRSLEADLGKLAWRAGQDLIEQGREPDR